MDRQWIVRHSDALGMGLAVLLGYAAFSMYRTGAAVGEARGVDSEFARLTSESLGG